MGRRDAAADYADHGEVMTASHDLLFLIAVGPAPSATFFATPADRGPIHRQADGWRILKGLIALGAVQDVDESLPRGRGVCALAEVVQRVIAEGPFNAGFAEAGRMRDSLHCVERRLAQKLSGQHGPQ